MNKIIKIKKIKVERTINISTSLLNIPPSIVLNKLYLNIPFHGDNDASKIILNKLSSYMMQDKKKQRYDSEKKIVYEQLIEKMVASKMKCNYCRHNVLLFYTTKREPLQWTLDRLDNNQGHYTNNVVIACLKCNLERRCRDSKKFLFGKQMKIIKIK